MIYGSPSRMQRTGQLRLMPFLPSSSTILVELANPLPPSKKTTLFHPLLILSGIRCLTPLKTR